MQKSTQRFVNFPHTKTRQSRLEKKALVRAVNRWDSSFYKGPQADISLAVVTMATGIRVGL